ncbi:MAG: M81 family metallopeptidase [Gammaproteobacteria bacterium]|nr:M81 family metallopeptidase [Gammaproteobacteria bacterium]MCP4880282.1 M81 family metallopeptidase [Gammaproteobacteria bacterium]
MTKYNIAIAGFQHETNTFAPGLATYDEFLKEDSWPGLTGGDAIMGQFRGMSLPLAGYIDTALADGQESLNLHPILWASAEPSGYVAKDAYETIAQNICAGIAAINDLHGIYLDLHGAMVAQHVDDGEGELLRRIRTIVGPDLPIVVSLDLHANVSPALVEHCSAITIFRTYPHIDMAATGARAYALLNQLLAGSVFFKGLVQIPFLIPLTSQCTDLEPCRSIYQELLLQQASHADLISLDCALGFPAADTYDCGPCIVAFGKSQSQVDAVLAHLEQFIARFEDQLSGTLLPPDEAAKEAIILSKRLNQPIVIADAQDNPGAGASSDTTGIIRALLEHHAENTYVAVINDLETTQQAHRLGQGAIFTANLGGHGGVPGDHPIACDLQVCELANGEFTFTGDMYKGITAKAGPMALVKIIQPNSSVYVITSINRIQCLDLAIMRHLGVEPETANIIAVNSTVHFRADFDPIAAKILVAISPGFHPCDLSTLEYKKLRPGMRRC